MSSDSLPGLDVEIYPHLLDLIVAQAPYASLIALRGVCRALRTRADTFLNTGRVIISQTDPGHVPSRFEEMLITVSSVHGRIPAFAAWALQEPGIGTAQVKSGPDVESILSVSSAEGAALRDDAPASVKTEPTVCRRTQHLVTFPRDARLDEDAVANLRYTTSLDLVGSVACLNSLKLLQSRFRTRDHAMYTRVLPDAAGRDIYIQAEPAAIRLPGESQAGRATHTRWQAEVTGSTLVYFTSPAQYVAGRRNLSRLSLNDDWDEIVHIAYHPNDTYTANVLEPDGPPLGARKIVYAFHRAKAPCSMAAPEDELDYTGLNTYDCPALLDWIFAHAASDLYEWDVEITIINVHVLAGSEWLETSGVQGGPEAQFEARCSQIAGEEGEYMAKFTFKTMEEYRAGLSERCHPGLETTTEGCL